MNLSFYYGTDGFRVREAVEKKTASFLAPNKNGLVSKFDFEKEDCLEDIENILKRQSFFHEPELIMVYAYLSTKDLPKKNKKLFEFLNQEAEEKKEFESIRGATLEKWALEKITEAGFKVRSSVLKKLISRVISQEQLSQEIEKLAAFQNFHQKNEIDDQAVENLIKPPDQAVGNFALIDAIGARDTKKAVIFLNQALLEGVDSHVVLGQIIYQFRNLLRVKDSNRATMFEQGRPVSSEDVAKLTGLHPFVARKTSQQAKQFELLELKSIYRRLSELDIKSKNGQIDLVPALFKLVLSF